MLKEHLVTVWKTLQRSKIGYLLVLVVIGLTMLYPLLWMIGTAVKTNDPAELLLEGPGAGIFPSDKNIFSNLFPPVWHWENFLEVFRTSTFARYYLNSALVAVAVTLGQLVTSALAAFAFSRLKFRGSETLFFLYLATLMVPVSVTLIPLFIMMSKFGVVDSYFVLMIPPMFGAYGTFLLRQFFKGIPDELDEAACIDGCNAFGRFIHVILPLSGPALATLGIFTFLGNWQSFLYPLVMVSSDRLKTIPLGLLDFVDLNSANWPLLMAASVWSILPVVVIFLFGQRFFVSGVRLGGVKG
jgi:multiple sugar transport system permease protein